MARTREATIDALYRVDGKAEIVRGEIVLMSLTGGLPSFAAAEVFVRLREYARATKSAMPSPTEPASSSTCRIAGPSALMPRLRPCAN